jgi:hypothetical protein
LISEPIWRLQWEKTSFIQGVDYQSPKFGTSHALVPTPLILTEDVVRIYCSFVDQNFIGRIGWVDLQFKGKGFKVIDVSKDPFLDVGMTNSFSAYGTGLGAFWPKNRPDYLFYIGFNRPKNVKFHAFTGLVTIPSKDFGGVNSELEPFLGPAPGYSTIVGLHDLVESQGKLIAFVSLGDDFLRIDGKELPKYQVGIAVGTSVNDLVIKQKSILSVDKDVYRLGRPRIEVTTDGYELLVTAGNLRGEYFPLAYYSHDLSNWERRDLKSFTETVIPRFDDAQQCYLTRFNMLGHQFIAYNGNQMGRYGFGIAKARS